MKGKEPTRILVAVKADYMCYRGLQIGIVDFAETRAGWHVDLLPSDVASLNEWIDERKPHALILGPSVSSWLDEAREVIRRIPRTIALCCNLSAIKGFEKLPEVGVDDFQVGVVAAQHFLGKGFQHFGFISAPASAWWAQQRLEGFSAELRAAGFEPSRWETHYSHLKDDGEISTSRIEDWLQSQPKPLALLACNDSRAQECAQICEDLSIHVPSEIAILGVDNDDLFCRLCRPPLSSVMVPWERMGYRAAELLNQRLEGKSVDPGLHKVPASGVVERQSTDVIAVADDEVRAAVQFIRNNSSSPLTVDDVADAVPLSRRDLEQRFRKLLKRTPLEEIRSAHLSRAKMLLATTDMTIDEIALASGFASVHWFDKVFKQFLDSTPSAFRRQSRNR